MAVRSLVSVVDDDQSVRESLPDLLREFGFEAKAFASAEEFLASGYVDQTRCLILDIAMPGLDGVQVLQRILALEAAPPVIIVTGHEEGALSVQTRAMGAFDYITKPFDLSRLSRAVAAALAPAGEDTDSSAAP